MADSLQFSAAPSALDMAADPHDRSAIAYPVTTGVYVCIHGHFYQPPRENPYLNTVELQPSASPFHDWNERIHHECYRPNAFARILNDRGEVIRIVNNYEYISFNIGPTLMSWMENYDPITYQRILEADRRSCDRFGGHGNAIAQVYNHIIMPLANRRDKYTQIRWGKADFRRRFGRDPEGMWLAETAVDGETLEALVDEGIRFIILAPSQVQRCRPMAHGDHSAGEWHEVGGGQIDPSRPYRCFLKDANGNPHPERFLDVFFYDGPISRDMGFNDVLSSS
ncbi:MAG TPA: glycoside hydrolase, partial [Trichocoleus sp.]